MGVKGETEHGRKRTPTISVLFFCLHIPRYYETRRNGLLVTISMRRKVSCDEKGTHPLRRLNARWRGFFGRRHPPLDADHPSLPRTREGLFAHHPVAPTQDRGLFLPSSPTFRWKREMEGLFWPGNGSNGLLDFSLVASCFRSTRFRRARNMQVELPEQHPPPSRLSRRGKERDNSGP